MTPMRMGRILTIPLPQILQMMIARIATSAMGQFAEQLLMALYESISPIAMIMGPVTMGGKNLITFPAPNILNRRASTR